MRLPSVARRSTNHDRTVAEVAVSAVASRAETSGSHKQSFPLDPRSRKTSVRSREGRSREHSPCAIARLEALLGAPRARVQSGSRDHRSCILGLHRRLQRSLFRPGIRRRTVPISKGISVRNPACIPFQREPYRRKRPSRSMSVCRLCCPWAMPLLGLSRQSNLAARLNRSTHCGWIAPPPPNKRGKHPLGPLVGAWLNHASSKPMPMEPFHPKTRANVPKLEAESSKDRSLKRLPGFVGEPGKPPVQLQLPRIGGVEPETVFPSWILRLYDTMGGPAFTRGRGPYELRLFVGALLHVPIEGRNGHWRTMRFPLSDIEWHRLPEALERLASFPLGWVPVSGLGLVSIIIRPAGGVRGSDSEVGGAWPSDRLAPALQVRHTERRAVPSLLVCGCRHGSVCAQRAADHSPYRGPRPNSGRHAHLAEGRGPGKGSAQAGTEPLEPVRETTLGSRSRPACRAKPRQQAPPLQGSARLRAAGSRQSDRTGERQPGLPAVWTAAKGWQLTWFRDDRRSHYARTTLNSPEPPQGERGVGGSPSGWGRPWWMPQFRARGLG